MHKPTTAVSWRKDAHALKKYQFVYHFLPHPVEKKRATLLNNPSMLAYCLFILIVALLFRVIPKFVPGIMGYASNINTGDLLTYTNQRRAETGLSALRINSSLSLAAQRKAEHMFAKGYWAHIAPDGTEPWDFILGAGYDYVYAGENLAKNFSTSKDVVQAWYNSPSHRQNLMNKNYTEVGYAAVNGVLNGYETTLVVQMFGNPRSGGSGNLAKNVYQVETQAIVPEDNEVKNIQVRVVEQPQVYSQIYVKPAVNLSDATRIFTGMLGTFVTFLLALDLWYSRKLGIIKINGNTFAHISFLIIVIISIWFVLKPGNIL
jgi:hypothetical protein